MLHWDFFALLQSIPTPLEVASLAFFVDQVSPWDPCDSRGLQEWFGLAIACLVLILRHIDWHVPCYFKQHRCICCALSALSMYLLRPDEPSIAMAIVWPTFGKRARSQSVHATECDSLETEHDCSPATSETEEHVGIATSDAATEHLAGLTTLDSVIAVFAEDTTGDGLCQAANTLHTGTQRDIRNLCSKWG